MFGDWIHIKSQKIDMKIETGFSHLMGDINLYITKAVLGPVLTSHREFLILHLTLCFCSLQCLKVSPLNL